MIIKFQILKSKVVSSVKATTYLKGKVDESANQNAERLSYNETAGDEEVHEQKLSDLFDTAIEKAKIIFVDYLAPTAQTIGDNVIYYNKGEDDVINFTLNVSRRYNGTLANTLARLTANYVECYMTYWWWIKTTNLKQAEPYQAELALAEQEIRRSFVLCPPIVPTVPYTKTLSAKVDGSGNDGAAIIPIEEEATLSYTIDNGAIDDIEARSSDPSIIEVHRCQEPHTFMLKPVNTGFAVVTLFSRHSDKLNRDVEIIVRKEADDGV